MRVNESEVEAIFPLLPLHSLAAQHDPAILHIFQMRISQSIFPADVSPVPFSYSVNKIPFFYSEIRMMEHDFIVIIFKINA